MQAGVSSLHLLHLSCPSCLLPFRGWHTSWIHSGQFSELFLIWGAQRGRWKDGRGTSHLLADCPHVRNGPSKARSQQPGRQPSSPKLGRRPITWAITAAFWDLPHPEAELRNQSQELNPGTPVCAVGILTAKLNTYLSKFFDGIPHKGKKKSMLSMHMSTSLQVIYYCMVLF